MLDVKDFAGRLGRSREYPKGEMLFLAGDPADGLYYIESGEIRIYRMDDQGKEVEIVRLSNGEILGEAILFVRKEFPFFAQVSVAAQVLFISRERLFKELETNPDAVRFFLNLLATKCMTLNHRIEILGFRTVRQRLVQYLLSQCPGGGECRLELKIRKTELARLLGTISETLSRNLRQLQQEKKIRVNGKIIYVLDCPSLRAEIR